MSIKPSELVYIREPKLEDEASFIAAMQASQALHYPWVNPPKNSDEYQQYFQRIQQDMVKSYFAFDQANHLVGVFNIGEIIRGFFQNAFLGYYVVAQYNGKGYMSASLKLVLAKVFNELELHRLEANIQPANTTSILLVKRNGFRYEGYSPRYLKIQGKWCGHERWAITLEDYIKDDIDIQTKDHISIVPYDSIWPSMADSEVNKLKTMFPATMVVDIQHVGSTAIPNLAAKPIIDIQIAVNSLDAIKAIAIAELQKLEYEYWFENPDPSRMFFAKGMPPFGEKRTHHVHIVEYNSDHWRDKIKFRDYLREHADVAKEYEQLKMKLAKEYQFDREQYTAKKSVFIKDILKR